MMTLPKRYNPKTSEPEIQALWQQLEVYNFNPESSAPTYSIDTPPPTISGKLHLGHTFSYSHPDFIARFWRMRGSNVFYPMGFDDNGLPTERLVEKQLGLKANALDRSSFRVKCLEISDGIREDYIALWKRLGLSVDWNYTYRTIDSESRRIAQLSFIRQHKKGEIYRQEAPTIWCPECHTAISQAELNDMDQQTELVTLLFKAEAGSDLKIATTRPELLPACVAIFVHPDDSRYKKLIGKTAQVPLFNQRVPVLPDRQADPEKGTGAVMCCTFGDQTDVSWWHSYKLPLIEAIDKEGKMTAVAGQFTDLSIQDARKQIKDILKEVHILIDTTSSTHSIRVHERCDTPAEYILTKQWFVNILDSKGKLIDAGEQINWHPQHMKSRYRTWVENLNWDWCISRQRYFGVPVPVWYCQNCGKIILAEETQLPIEPASESPPVACPACGSSEFQPDPDVLDTWATSSLSPQIAAGWLDDPTKYRKLFPFSLRPQAHEIIRTWAFYTIVKSLFHFGKIPWKDVLISGWGIAGKGGEKISKSRGGGPMPPQNMIEKYSADAVRYWAASTGPGKDAVINEEKIQTGSKLINKIWNVARFSSRFSCPAAPPLENTNRTPFDDYTLHQTQQLIERVTMRFENYDYAAAKSDTEAFFWHFADDYLEIAKQRLYDPEHPEHLGAVATLHYVLLILLKLFAPILPFVTERIYQKIFSENNNQSIHTSEWPVVNPALINNRCLEPGEIILDTAAAIRRFKSEQNLSLGTPLKRLQLAIGDQALKNHLDAAKPDLASVTRSLQVDVSNSLDETLTRIPSSTSVIIGIEVEPTS